MLDNTHQRELFRVALRKESVDRNTNCTSIGRPKRVALRKESVDRNVRHTLHDFHAPKVALRKESVDRNELTFKIRIAAIESLSARRAWIEMGIK